MVGSSSFRWNDKSIELDREVPAFAGMTSVVVGSVRRFQPSLESKNETA